MAQSNPGNQRNENIVGPDGKQGGNFVNSNIYNPTFIIGQQPEQRRDPSTTPSLDEEVASFLARLHLNELTEIFRRQRLSMDDILELSNEELKDIGVDLLKHRKLIMEEAEMISSTVGASQHNNPIQITGSSIERVFTLSATGRAGEKWSSCLGDYSLSEQVHNARPVYRNSEGIDLWSQEDGTWAADRCVGNSAPAIKSTTAAVSPGLCQHWQYMYTDCGGIYKPGDITVTRNLK